MWRGVRFWMSGSGWAYSWRACLWSVLTLLTLGQALPWRESALERYKMRHLHYGDLEGRFEGTGWGLLKRGWWLWLLSLLIVTVPFTYPAVPVRALAMVGVGRPLRRGAFRVRSAHRRNDGPLLGRDRLDRPVADRRRHSGARSQVPPPCNCGGEIGNGDMLVLLRQHPYLFLGANLGNYLVLALCAGIVVRVYLVRELWKRVVTSVTAHHLDGADNVRAEGTLASALGEGLADGLDIAGF